MLYEVVETSVLISALAGVGSFFSPCILPIIPAFCLVSLGHSPYGDPESKP